MDIFTLLQTETILAKSAEMAQKDPYGWIITVVSISVVFVSLALLFILYYLIGRLVSRFSKEEDPQTQNTVAGPSAAGPSAAEPEDSAPHDKESYVITICSKDRISISSPAPKAADNNSGERQISAKEITAPLPGVITNIKVKAGDSVRSGQVVAVLEAMKMENDLLAARDGTVKEIKVEKGEGVLEGAVIITFE